MLRGWTAGKCSEKQEAEAWGSEVSPRFDKQDYNTELVTNGAMKPLGAINIPQQAWSASTINSVIAKALKLFCPRAAKWIQVYFQGKIKEVEQTKVSQFLPCDSESFPRNIRDCWVYTHYISSSVVLPREHLTFRHSDEDVQDQWKTHRKHGKAGFWDKLLHYYILLTVSSLLKKCYPSSKLLPQIPTTCAHIAVEGSPGWLHVLHRQRRKRAKNKPDKGWPLIHFC